MCLHAHRHAVEITPDNENPEGTGLLGLGPNYGSNIFISVGSKYGGVAVVDRIFAENTSTPNYITTYLGRAEDPTDTFEGEITISETVDGFEKILDQPKLDVTLVSMSSSQQNQHWQTLLDANGIEVNGKAISLPSSSVSGQSKLTAVMDTVSTINPLQDDLRVLPNSARASQSLKSLRQSPRVCSLESRAPSTPTSPVLDPPG